MGPGQRRLGKAVKKADTRNAHRAFLRPVYVSAGSNMSYIRYSVVDLIIVSASLLVNPGYEKIIDINPAAAYNNSRGRRCPQNSVRFLICGL